MCSHLTNGWTKTIMQPNTTHLIQFFLNVSVVHIQEYWDSHSIEDIPPKLGKNVKTDLANSKVVSNDEIMEKTREIYRNTEHEIKIIKPMLSENDIIEANALMSRKISFSYIVKDRVQLEYKIRQLLRDIGWEKKASDETLKRKMSERVPICMIFNEESGIVCFPDDRGKADLTSGLYSTDKRFVEWCHEYFKHVENISEDFDQDKIPKVFTTIHNENARDILSLIKGNERMRPKDMAQILAMADPEINRQSNSIIDSGLGNKDSNGFLKITSLGKLIYDNIMTISYLTKKSRYFQEHSFDDLPNIFRLSIGALSKSELVFGIPLVKHKWDEIYQNSFKYDEKVIKAIKPQVNIDSIKIAHEEIFKGVKYLYILPENVVAPPTRDEVLTRLQWKALIREGKIGRKMMDEVTIATVLNEKEAMVCFPDDRGLADLTSGLYSTDKRFVEWCSELFAFTWKNAEEFKEEKIRKI
jgi:predicted transcriptional regulator